IGLFGTPIAIHCPSSLPKNPISGEHIRPWVRTGSTPTPGPATWTEWNRLESAYRLDDTPHHRWAQVRFDIPGHSRQGTLKLEPSIEIPFTFETNGPIEDLVVNQTVGPRILQGSTPFVYQELSPRLKLLRERYQLDKVIAPGKTEMEQLML